jgi:hypothetical protein
MSRVIKFRAWDKENLVVVPFTRDWICEEYSSIAWSPPDDHEWSGIGALPGSYGHLADNEPIGDQYELMQFTGLYDKNGVEIYEGDVVRIWAKANFHSNERYPQKTRKTITWNERTSGWNARTGIGLEVIGNIYAKPKLLEQPS